MESFDRLLRDIRYGVRSLRKSPVLAAAVILILALGIGANTAIFIVLHGVVLAPLPYRDADRVVTVLLYNRTLKFVSYLSYPDFLDWQRSSRSFERISVVAIDSLLARTYFPDRDAIGQILTITHWGADTNVPFRIVGVVGHVKHYGLDDSVTEKPQIYYSFYQLPGDVVPVFRADVTLVVRTAADSAALLPAIRTAVSEVGGDQPVYNIHTMEELVSGSMSRQRFPMLLLVAFAVLALLLAFVGTYAVISYSTARRAHEIGICMVLGAAKRDILRMVLAQGLRLALVGVVAGAAMSLVLTRLMSGFRRLLFGVRAADPLTFLAVSLLLITSALAACYIPACRAPTAAFRDD